MRSPLEVRLLSKIEIDAETNCWNWTGSKFVKTGYGQISLGRKNMYVHRVSYELRNGAIPSGLHVCHRCDNRVCANPDHLFLGTPADNIADRDAKGRQARGTAITKNRRPNHGVANGNVKLTEADVVAIRACAGIPHRRLAKQFGVGPTQIRRILNGESWPIDGASFSLRESSINRVPHTSKAESAEHDSQHRT